MTRDEALRRLDEIEHLDPDQSVDAGALGIMQELAESIDGLRLLVERYSSSPSENIVGFLALLIAEISNKSTPETAPLVFEFVARLQRSDHDGALISSLGAMKRQIGFGAGWGDTPRPPSSLFAFLHHCLNYSGRHSVLVQFGAVEVVTTLCWGKLLKTAFEPHQIRWMRGRIEELSGTDNALLRDSTVEFVQCLGQEALT